MAKRKGLAPKSHKAARRKKASVKVLRPRVVPGTLFSEGVAVEVSEPDDNAEGKLLVWLGRLALAGESPATGERSVMVAGQRVFFSDAQAGIDAKLLHRLPLGAGPQAPSRSPAPASSTPPGGSGPFFELFEIGQGVGPGWMWHIKARNGKILADSAEQYSSKAEAQAAIDRLNNADWPLVQA